MERIDTTHTRHGWLGRDSSAADGHRTKVPCSWFDTRAVGFVLSRLVHALENRPRHTTSKHRSYQSRSDPYVSALSQNTTWRCKYAVLLSVQLPVLCVDARGTRVKNFYLSTSLFVTVPSAYLFPIHTMPSDHGRNCEFKYIRWMDDLFKVLWHFRTVGSSAYRSNRKKMCFRLKSRWSVTL
jgi:hypothetical protein